MAKEQIKQLHVDCIRNYISIKNKYGLVFIKGLIGEIIRNSRYNSLEIYI